MSHSIWNFPPPPPPPRLSIIPVMCLSTLLSEWGGGRGNSALGFFYFSWLNFVDMGFWILIDGHFYLRIFPPGFWEFKKVTFLVFDPSSDTCTWQDYNFLGFMNVNVNTISVLTIEHSFTIYITSSVISWLLFHSGSGALGVLTNKKYCKSVSCRQVPKYLIK